MTPTPEQLRLMQHALGCPAYGRNRKPFRNYFTVGETSDAYKEWRALEAGGFAVSRTPSELTGSMWAFHCTEAGEASALAALPPLKGLSTYQKYLAAEPPVSFGEYLMQGKSLPKFERNTAGQYRMFRIRDNDRDVEGQWAGNRADAKASYKEALRERLSNQFD